SRSSRTNTCLATNRATLVVTTHSERSPCRWTVNLACGRDKATARRLQNDVPTTRAGGDARLCLRPCGGRPVRRATAATTAAAGVSVRRRGPADRRHRL